MKGFLIGVLLTLAIAVGLGVFMRSRGTLALGRTFRGPMRQPTGDPPVTLSDGSLHAHSQKGWVSPEESATITPNGSKLSTDCKDMTGLDDNWVFFAGSHQASVTFWADDTESLDISPGANGPTTITLKYASGGKTGTTPNVTITADPSSSTPLTIVSTADSFLRAPSHSDNYDRAHSRDGEVEQITISGANYAGNNMVWIPQNKLHPHFTLGFCFVQ